MKAHRINFNHAKLKLLSVHTFNNFIDPFRNQTLQFYHAQFHKFWSFVTFKCSFITHTFSKIL